MSFDSHGFDFLSSSRCQEDNKKKRFLKRFDYHGLLHEETELVKTYAFKRLYLNHSALRIQNQIKSWDVFETVLLKFGKKDYPWCSLDEGLKVKMLDLAAEIDEKVWGTYSAHHFLKEFELNGMFFESTNITEYWQIANMVKKYMD